MTEIISKTLPEEKLSDKLEANLHPEPANGDPLVEKGWDLVPKDEFLALRKELEALRSRQDSSENRSIPEGKGRPTHLMEEVVDNLYAACVDPHCTWYEQRKVSGIKKTLQSLYYDSGGNVVAVGGTQRTVENETISFHFLTDEDAICKGYTGDPMTGADVECGARLQISDQKRPTYGLYQPKFAKQEDALIAAGISRDRKARELAESKDRKERAARHTVEYVEAAVEELPPHITLALRVLAEVWNRDAMMASFETAAEVLRTKHGFDIQARTVRKYRDENKGLFQEYVTLHREVAQGSKSD